MQNILIIPWILDSSIGCFWREFLYLLFFLPLIEHNAISWGLKTRVHNSATKSVTLSCLNLQIRLSSISLVPNGIMMVWNKYHTCSVADESMAYSFTHDKAILSLYYDWVNFLIFLHSEKKTFSLFLFYKKILEFQINQESDKCI